MSLSLPTEADAAPSYTDLDVGGMSCAACVARVERALAAVPGVDRAEVNLATESARVVHDAHAVRASTLIAAVQDIGYEAKIHDAQAPPEPVQHPREQWTALIACALAAPLLLPMLLAPFGVDLMMPGWWQFALATPVQFVLGARFYQSAWRALRTLDGTMDQLVALGTSAAWGLSTWTLITQADHAHLYFEASSVVIALVLLGKWLELRARRGTAAAINALRGLRPERVRVRVGERELELPLEHLAAGDLVLIRPAQRIAVDGIVIEGESHVDESMLTGESRPIHRRPGDHVIGGTLNGEGALAVRTVAVGPGTVLARIIGMVEAAQLRKAPIQRLVDRVSAVFVPLVLLAACITLIAWRVHGAEWSHALINAVAVLVIACPCALGLATPTALMAGTGAAARQGILIRDAQALEAAHRVNIVAFDKTGTLTVGRPELLQCVSVPGVARVRLLEMVTRVQAQSEHPLARALRHALESDAQSTAQTLAQAAQVGSVDSVAPPSESFETDAAGFSAHHIQSVPGCGVRADITPTDAAGNPAGEPFELLIGNERWMSELAIPLGTLANAGHVQQAQGHTVSFVAVRTAGAVSGKPGTPAPIGPAADGALAPHAQGEAAPAGPQAQVSDQGASRGLALLVFGDAPRPQSREAIAKLHAIGVRTLLVSGDNAGAAGAIARTLGIDEHHANVLPQGKAELITQLKHATPGSVVAMVGDGINDAPALAAADIGIALGSGTDVAMHAAGITLMRSDPRAVADALDIARRTHLRIRLNLFWALAYNVVGIPMAALGLLNPVLAGSAMALSSVSVVLSSLHLARWRAPGS